MSSPDISCVVQVYPNYQGVNDYVTTALNGNITYNVLSNDVRYNCTTGVRVPLLLSTVNLQQVGTTNPYFSIFPTGAIVQGLLNPPSGTYILSYQLTDTTFPVLVQTIDIFITVPTARIGNSVNLQDDFNLEKTIISPNPNDGNFSIVFETIIDAATIEVYTLLGQKLDAISITDAKEYQYNNQRLTSGTYLIKISSNEQTVYKRIIVN